MRIRLPNGTGLISQALREVEREMRRTRAARSLGTLVQETPNGTRRIVRQAQPQPQEPAGQDGGVWL